MLASMVSVKTNLDFLGHDHRNAIQGDVARNAAASGDALHVGRREDAYIGPNTSLWDQKWPAIAGSAAAGAVVVCTCAVATRILVSDGVSKFSRLCSFVHLYCSVAVLGIIRLMLGFECACAG